MAEGAHSAQPGSENIGGQHAKQGGSMTRLEQRGDVAFTGMGVAVAVILLITLWGYLF